MSHEDLLRDTLRAKADEASVALTLDDVRRDAAAHRRRTAWRTTLVAAAAVLLVVGAPVALLLGRDASAPSPAPSPTATATATSSPTETPTPTPTVPQGLAAIPRGADPRVAYLHQGKVHEPDGSTVRLPADDVTQFTPYHGGWLTVSSTGALTQWDNTGTTVQVLDGECALAVSADQLRTAYGIPGEIHVGIGSGMGNGEVTYSVGTAGLVGFVRDGVVFSGGAGGTVGYIDQGTRHVVPGLVEADASASGSDVIGGLAPDGVSGRVVTEKGDVLWTSAWQPRAFSPDGRYAVAVLAPDGEPTDLAVLDARSGRVVSRLSLHERGLAEAGPPVWEESSGSVLVQVQDADHQAVLRLARTGSVSLATDTEPSSALPTWFFAATP